MKAYTKRLSGTLAILMLVIAFAIPATAMAAEGVQTKLSKASMVDPVGTGDCLSDTGDGSMAVGTPLSEQRKEMLKARVRDRIQTRAQLFDRAAEALTARIMRLERIAARLSEAGCDVGEALALLGEARGLVGDALRLEAQAAEAFRGIPDAEAPRTAFREARGLAIEASGTLCRARQKVGEAARLLGLCVEGLIAE